jgi:hypothetical protein
MVLPFRNNPKITTNWLNTTTGKFVENKTKKSYYEISTVKVPGSLSILFREEKKRLGGSAEKARTWFGNLGFELDSTFARDLKMFLNEFVDADNDEVKNTVRIYFTGGKWCVRKGSGEVGLGDTPDTALIDLSATVSKSIINNSDQKDISAEKR